MGPKSRSGGEFCALGLRSGEWRALCCCCTRRSIPPGRSGSLWQEPRLFHVFTCPSELLLDLRWLPGRVVEGAWEESASPFPSSLIARLAL